MTKSNEYEDLHPEMQKHGFLFKLNGKENAMYLDPQGNHCSSCGKKKSQENWCRHLVSAGYKMSPKIIVKPKQDGTKSLDKLMKYQKSSKGKTGRKAPKVNDFKDDFVTPIPSRAPYGFSNKFDGEKR